MYIYVEVLTSDQKLISKQRLCLVTGRYNKKKAFYQRDVQTNWPILTIRTILIVLVTRTLGKQNLTPTPVIYFPSFVFKRWRSCYSVLQRSIYSFSILEQCLRNWAIWFTSISQTMVMIRTLCPWVCWMLILEYIFWTTSSRVSAYLHFGDFTFINQQSFNISCNVNLISLEEKGINE